MRIKYLPANQRWVVVFGDGQLLDLDGQRLFETHDDLVVALRYAGLQVGRTGKVSLTIDLMNRNA